MRRVTKVELIKRSNHLQEEIERLATKAGDLSQGF